MGWDQAPAVTDDEKINVSVYQKASPSVVNVISTVITRDFFLNPIPREGSGSGSVIDPQGHILTNNHVIRDAQKLEVTLVDGSKWPAKNIQILGTDLSTPILERARAARYCQVEVNRGLPAMLLVKYFQRAGLDWQLKEEVRRMARFERFDLRGGMRMLGPFDIVFCRNVLIYFDLETK